eukprot:15016895-Ditylum_brightwellii.AAC.2
MDLFDAHVALLQYAYDKCYSYEQWENLVNMVIVKVLGINKINCLRILTLYEANNAICMGLMWKELIESSKERKSINRGLLGGRQGHAAQTLDQGATKSPGIQLATCSTFGDVHDESAHGTQFVSPDQEISVLLAILGFVDGATNQANMFKDNNVA